MPAFRIKVSLAEAFDTLFTPPLTRAYSSGDRNDPARGPEASSLTDPSDK